MTVVLLHAFPFDSRMWDRVRTLPDLITPDLPGFGGVALPDADPDLDVLADAVLAQLDGIERPVLGGCSMGGYVAMAMLRKDPARFSGLLFIDTKATADTDEARANRLAVAARAEAEGIEPWLAESMVPQLVAGPAAGDAVRALMRGQDPAAVAWCQRAMAARPASHDVLAAAGLPTLVVHGAQDGLMPVAVAEDLAEAASGTLTVLPGVGHLPPVEAPSALLAAVEPWLAGL